MNKKKLSLKELKVNSFITNLEGRISNTVKGGTGATQNLECDSGPVNGCAILANTEDFNNTGCRPSTEGNCKSIHDGCKAAGPKNTNERNQTVVCFN